MEEHSENFKRPGEGGAGRNVSNACCDYFYNSHEGEIAPSKGHTFPIPLLEFIFLNFYSFFCCCCFCTIEL